MTFEDELEFVKEECEFTDRRTIRRRAEDEKIDYKRRESDYSTDVNVENLKLTVREVIVIILAFSSIATGFITFNSAIEKNQAENLTKSEVISTRVSNIENRLDKIESKIDSIRDHMMPISKP